MSRNRALATIGALVLAALGTIGMVAYVSGAEQRAVEGETLREVFMVTERIPAGVPAERVFDSVQTELVPAKLVNSKTVGTEDGLDGLDGLVTDVALLPGEILSVDRFVSPQAFDRASERVIDVPVGLQEITLALEPDRAGGNLLVPGDTVGVIMSFDPFEIGGEDVVEVDDIVLPAGSKTNFTTHQALHKVLVTNVQFEEVPEVAEREGLDEEDDREIRLVPSGNLLVTFAVDVAAAERLIFGAEYGKIWLTNQGSDAAELPSLIQNRGTVYSDIEVEEGLSEVGDQS